MVGPGSFDKKARLREAREKRYAKVQKWREELVAFIATVEQCAEQGPPPTNAACPLREANARYVLGDLDDGVMINKPPPGRYASPVEGTQENGGRNSPRRKARRITTGRTSRCATGRRGSTRSAKTILLLGVAHGCFWKYHPARAWTWELRFQDEIGPEFRIEEAPTGVTAATRTIAPGISPSMAKKP